MKKNVIITSANKRDGDFLVEHWLRSLKENVNLHNVDILVLDYGLKESQLENLKKESVIAISGKRDGHVVNQRFIDAGKYLSHHDYDQVLFTDGGDVIFQKDIASLFYENKDDFRAVPIDTDVLFFEYAIPGNFTKTLEKKMYRFLKNKPILNAGFILAPKSKFISLGKEIERLVKRRERFGPDQVVLNYYVYQHKAVFLDKKYNFMISSVKEGFSLKEGVFYQKNGEKIAVVHNAGRSGFLRPINNFGYGRQFNRIKYIVYILKKIFYRNASKLKNIAKLRLQWK